MWAPYPGGAGCLPIPPPLPLPTTPPLVSSAILPKPPVPFQFPVPPPGLFPYPGFPFVLPTPAPIEVVTRGSNPVERIQAGTPSALVTPNAARKRKREREVPHVKRIRHVRPKVDPNRGHIQCIGFYQKRKTKCKNAALMEYIGPRPLYCAQHIEQDPQSLYCLCKATYTKPNSDKQAQCKEVVLKEFRFCYKHFGELIDTLQGREGYDQAKQHLLRVNTLRAYILVTYAFRKWLLIQITAVTQIEREYTSARKTDPDIFRRKRKIKQKYQEMKTALETHLMRLAMEYGIQHSPSLKTSSEPEPSLTEATTTTTTTTSATTSSPLASTTPAATLCGELSASAVRSEATVV